MSILIKQLFIFPIKSLGSISVNSVDIEAAGFKGDRRFMLIDSFGKFITQRTRPDLTRFRLSLHVDGYLVDDCISGFSKVLSNKPVLKEMLAAELWDDDLQVAEVGEEWSEWFSEVLGEPIRLVMQQAHAPRMIADKYRTSGSGESSFADSLPILIASESSYLKLEDVYGQSFDLLRFRANLVVSGCKAFDEDTWEEISLHHVRLFGAKPCARCQLVNVEPHTGVVDQGGVLNALASFRKRGNQVYFGQQMVPITQGKIQVGDEIVILKRKDALF